MQYEKTVVRNKRMEAVIELTHTVSGLLLVLFLWTHLIFVGSILLGVKAFDTLAKFMEDYYLLPAAVLFVVFTFTAHVGAVSRRIPGRWREMKVLRAHAKRLNHHDTSSWLFQMFSGIAILILAAIHVFSVVWGGIDSSLSSDRVQSPMMLWMYLPLLILAEMHASVGVYRAGVKWGIFTRQPFGKVMKLISYLLIILGLVILWVFWTLDAGGAV